MMYKFGFYLVVASLVTAACNHSGGTTDLHDHGADPVAPSPVQSTFFTDRFEFFVEHDALVSGTPSDFLVHVTDLETYDPVTAGSLTIRIGDRQVTAHAPVRPGIFEAELVPGISGAGEITYSLQGGNVSVMVHAHTRVGAADVHEHEAEAAHDHEAEVSHDHEAEVSHDHETEASHDHEASAAHEHAAEASSQHDPGSEHEGHIHEGDTGAEGEITFTKEQAWKSDFMVRKVVPVPFSAVVKASGQLLAVPGKKKHLAAHTSGMLVFRDKLLVQGARVEKGQPLFVIVAASLSADNFEVRYRELRNNLEQSRSEFRRHEALYADQVISERQYIASKTSYINDSIRFNSLASKASAGGLQISAPISGYIHELNFSEGQYVETGDQLVTISSNEKLLLRADVPMQYYPMVDQVVTANFRTGYSDRIYNVDALQGTLLSRGSSVAENDHFIPVYFEVTNDGTLLEGAFVEFYLKTLEEERVIAVPAGAISEEQGIHYCYLQATGESYTKQEVKVEENDGIYYRISAGLKPGDRVVTEGIMLLKAASMVVGDPGHGHAH
jgi:RND family efflux transporter MFP subunit